MNKKTRARMAELDEYFSSFKDSTLDCEIGEVLCYCDENYGPDQPDTGPSSYYNAYQYCLGVYRGIFMAACKDPTAGDMEALYEAVDFYQNMANGDKKTLKRWKEKQAKDARIGELKRELKELEAAKAGVAA